MDLNSIPDSFPKFEEFYNNNLFSDNFELFPYSTFNKQYLPIENLDSLTFFQNVSNISNKLQEDDKNISSIIFIKNEYDETKEIKFIEEGKGKAIPPIQYTFEKIINEIFPKFNDSLLPLKYSLLFDSNISKIEKNMSDNYFLSKKKRRKKGKIRFNEPESKKRGRKKQDDSSRRKHDKNSPDNIIKKIKSKCLEYALKFINKTLNSFIEKDRLISYNKMLRKQKNDLVNLIKFLDYKFVDKIKRETELNLLKMPLKEIFSNNISPRYSTLPRDSNRRIIERIIKDEKNNEIIMFALNLTFGEWLDVFTYKKELKDIKNFEEKKMKNLIDKFDRIDMLLKEIYQSNYSNNYLSYFICLIYNYERWFCIKNGRNRLFKNDYEN